jgi:AmmeMemoRadiSam system protein B
MATTHPHPCDGRFYPAGPKELRRSVRSFLAGSPANGRIPKAVIVPHAGYDYSGPVAARAYQQLAQARRATRRVVLLGPSHFAFIDGLAVTQAAALSTPLGAVPVDRNAVMMLSEMSGIYVLDHIHAVEHSLQVQLPFLQVALERFAVIPLAVGSTTPSAVGTVLDQLWGLEETRIVVSSDLSHDRDDGTARRLDRSTSRLIEDLQPSVDDERACGAPAINGLLWTARRRHLRAETLALRTSADATGMRDHVVGYGAFAFYEP